MGSINADGTIPKVAYGFIGMTQILTVTTYYLKLTALGLGNMGFHMATNLISHFPPGASLVVCEIVTKTRDRFLAEVKGPIKIAETPKEVAERCVRVVEYR